MVIPFALFALAPKARGELQAAIGTGDTSFSLLAGQGERYPAANFGISIDAEQMFVGSRSGDVLSSVTRGWNGTTATTHVIRALVQLLGEDAHGHSQADIDGLVVALAAKQALSEKAQANGYASLGADGKVPSGQLPASGSDPWTYVRLTSDFTTSSATAVDVTGLSFTPLANQRYEFEAQLFLRTNTATVNPRSGLAWPTGLTDGVAQITQSQAATGTPLAAAGNPNAALLVVVGGLPNTTQSWPARIAGTVIAGASPSGNVRVQLASETAGTVVTVKAGSFLRFRSVP